MFRGGSFFFLRAVMFLVVIGVLIGGAVMLYQSGQAQGYAMGLAAAGKQVNAPQTGSPAAPVYPGYGPGYWPGFYPGIWQPHFFFFPFGPLFGLFFFLLFFFLIGGFIRGLIWRRAFWGGPWRGGPRGEHPWGTPPWEREQGERGPDEYGQPSETNETEK